ncbi:MAG: hypothetical protein CMF62_00145 [Magnetococcales bacterium]|nr:hypothetical protein [Magnetococcales bacterium]|tara:strand:- start:8681 stop:9568 length:888 start_codon:yes stop_codon:yes gene_type:complete
MTTTITTHNGQFHADEVFAYTLLNNIFPDNKLIRTRDEKIINKSDIVIDVGMKYDPENNRFDHHQKNCNEKFSDMEILMSSAGMVFKTYGKLFLEKKFQDTINNDFYIEVYKNIVLEIDAIDNGIKQEKSKYYINTGISRMVSRFNSFEVFDDKKQLEQFFKAVEYTQTVLDIVLHELYQKHLLFKEEYTKMKQIIDKTTNEYIIVDFNCENWYKCIKKYESENPDKNKINWIIYKDSENWRIRTVSFESKKLKDEEYLRSVVTNPDEIIFVHKALFIASSKTIETVIEIAENSL